MIAIPKLEQPNFYEVLVDAGFVTVNIPCDFTFSETPELVDIHFTTNAQIHGKNGFTLYIRNPHPTTKTLSYAATVG